MPGRGRGGLRLRAGAAALALGLSACRADRPAQRVVVAYASGAQALRPHLANDEYTSSILGNAFEPLVALDGELGLQPVLAESWHTPDDLTWVFRLRAGVRFHDGTALEARHVVAALEQARGDPASRIRSELAAVAGFEARDERTVVVRTHRRFGALLNRLCTALVYRDAPPGGGLPLGTGPFRLTRRERDGSVLLSAFDGYRAGPPALAELEFQVVPNHREQLERLTRGEVHLTSEVRPDELEALRLEPSLRVVSRSGLMVLFLALDCAHAASPHVTCPAGPCNPLRDVRVRRALASAIDRQALLRGPIGGRGEVVEQIVAPEAFGAERGLRPWPHDPEAARRLLREAGFASGFELRLDYLQEDQEPDDAVVQALAADLAQVGIRVQPRVNDLQGLLRRVESHDSAAYLMPWIGTSADFGSSADYLLRSPGAGYGSHNGGGYASAELDALLLQAEAQLQPGARQRLLRAAGRRIHDDLPVLPLVRWHDLYATAARLAFRPRLDRQVRGAELRWLEGDGAAPAGR